MDISIAIMHWLHFPACKNIIFPIETDFKKYFLHFA